MASDVKPQNLLFTRQPLRFRPLRYLRQLHGRSRFGRAFTHEQTVLAALRLALPPGSKFHGTVECGHHLRTMDSQGVKRPRLDQAFEHPLVKQPQVNVFAKLKDVVEAAQLLARRQHRLDGSLSHVLDRSEAKADTLTCRRESMIARIDVGRQDTDSHVAAFIQVKR